MLPIPMAGIAIAGTVLLSKYSRNLRTGKIRFRFKLQPKFKKAGRKKFTLKNPLQTLTKGLSHTMSQIISKPTKEDYDAIMKNHLPDNAKVIIPQYPARSSRIQITDIDGDSHNELIASYKLNDEIKTIILKKQSRQWYKAAEISTPGCDAIHYRGAADITGEGRKQLILGVLSKDKLPTLYGYSLDKNAVRQLFARNYHRFELLPQPAARYSAPKTRLAIWSKNDADTFDIEVLHWNGSQLEPLKDISRYYYRSVVPYHILKARQMPYTPSNWYNLAEALAKAGIYRDALIATEVGMKMDRDSVFKDRFMALRNEITGE